MSRQRKDHFFGTTAGHEKVYELDLSRVVPNPNQPRKHFNEESLQELAASIERHGLMQPIAVQKMAEGEQYMIVAGERRFRAHQLLSRPTIRAVFVTGDPEELALIENLQREDLNPIDEAEALSALQERHGYTQEQLSEVVGKARSSIAELLRLTMLPESIKAECRTSDRASKSVLIEISRVNDEERQLSLWQKVKNGAATVRATRERKQGKEPQPRAEPSEVARALSVGRSFARRIEAIPDEYLSANQADYAALHELAEQISHRLAAARQVIGEPMKGEAEENL